MASPIISDFDPADYPTYMANKPLIELNDSSKLESFVL